MFFMFIALFHQCYKCKDIIRFTIQNILFKIDIYMGINLLY
jgi:hypothetical protein